MRFYHPDGSDKNFVAYKRCFQDAMEGRASIALLRLKDMHAIFPGDGHLLYAEALIRIQFLGQGLQGQQLCWQAFQSDPTIVEALFNSIKYAPNEQEFHNRAAEALRVASGEPAIQQLLYIKSSQPAGEPFWKHYLYLFSGENDYGEKASLMELLLKCGGDLIPPPEYAHYLQVRGDSLRALDRAAEDRLRAQGERFQPEDRIALKQALSEYEAQIEDPYFRTPERINFCSAWSLLLHEYHKAIRYADLAIEARPTGYVYPYRNKALALWEVGSIAEGSSCMNEALAQAERAGDQVQIKEIRDAIELRNSPEVKRIGELIEFFQGVLQGAGGVAYTEISSDGKSTLEGEAGSLLKLIRRVGVTWSMKYLSVVDGMLMHNSPEAAHFIILRTRQMASGHVLSAITENIMYAAVYLVGFGEGVTRRDAARLVTLYILQQPDEEAIIHVYGQAVRYLSAAADPPLAELESLIDNQMARLHPKLPQLLKERTPLTLQGVAKAREIIGSRYGKPGVYPSDAGGSPYPQTRLLFYLVFLLGFGYLLGHYLRWW